MPNTDGSYIITIEENEGDCEDAIRQGRAVVRKVSMFSTLHASLCQENIQVTANFPTLANQQSLQEYVRTILQVPEVVHSKALLEFFSALPEDAAKEEPSTTSLQCVQYLLPGIQSPTYHPVPRFGSYQQTTDTILPGWWLVWYLHSHTPVTLEVSVIPQEGVAQEQLIHNETCESSCSFGSYRVLTEPSRAVLKVTGRTVLSGSTSRNIFLEYDTIPHLAFVAACTAANDVITAAENRRRAPLWARILDSDQHLTICVQSWDDADTQPTSTDELNVPTGPTVEALNSDPSDEVMTLQRQLQTWKVTCDTLRQDLATSQGLVAKLNQRLEIAGSERRVWNVVRSELQVELSRLAEELDTEKKKRVQAMTDLEEARHMLGEVSGQVKLMELRDDTGSYSSAAKHELDELRQVVTKLESDLRTERCKSERLERESHDEIKLTGEIFTDKPFLESIGKIEKSANARVAKATDDVHEATMAQRALEYRVRHLEQEKRRARVPNQSPEPERLIKDRLSGLALDNDFSHFQHPDPRLNQQLLTLRDRHRKLSNLVAQSPDNLKNREILHMLEKAIHDIVSNSTA